LKKYKHLFFDLDGTLWDLRRNTRAALTILFDKYKTELSSIDFEAFFKRYHFHNDKVWALYRNNLIEKEVLRYVRFERAFNDTGFVGSAELIRNFSDDFMEICPRQPHTIEGTHELLKYCFGKYDMHIITNGFIEVQGHKMNAANLNSYFTHMINSEHCGVRKPHPEIFEYALNKAGADKSSSLMIGDDWDADILGARDFGMDQAYLTTTDDMLSELNEENGHDKIRHNYKPTYAIKSLHELMDIL
jgi:YjjG family noncanonical pyrimidine nucleotidase